MEKLITTYDKFKYNPLLSLEDMAIENSVKGMKLRSLIEERGYDYNTDRHNALRREVKKQIERARKNGIPEDGIYEHVSKELSKTIGKMSVALVSYLDNSEERVKRTIRVGRKNIGASQLPYSSVKDTDADALKDILRRFLPRKKTFDCDLTFGQGGFYSEIPVPKHCYDEYPAEGLKVKQLDNARLDIESNSLQSVVIDLPVKVDAHEKSNEAFKSIEDLYDTYLDMGYLGADLLRSGGILVFKISEVVIRNSEYEGLNHIWIGDYLQDALMQGGVDLIDEIIVVSEDSYRVEGITIPKFTKRYHTFLIFKKL